ncbi:SRPBCC domain-containing protein [Chitinophaga sedimenti]|uniref:SRPBCC family protein n=1 Tax=Chitinophaga sedimenti TaxID=2033606 RepID=UPI0020054F80|nr:SRPBCC domain-containing protein [Chitinophaga sedimenti]MCK7555999.1 SRPBCC domain-containing protein [Chitinophaga sedimenti]
MSFEIKHVFKADLPTVFNMWVRPDRLSKWLGPDGARMTFVSADVREGGSARWEMSTNDGLKKYGQLSYKIINPASHLIYIQHFCDKKGRFVKAPFSATYPDYLLTTVHFGKEAEGRTGVTVKWEIFGEASETERSTFLEMKAVMRSGWTASFKKLEKLLK